MGERGRGGEPPEISGAEVTAEAEKKEEEREQMRELLASLRGFDTAFHMYCSDPETAMVNHEALSAAVEACPVLDHYVFEQRILRLPDNQRVFDHDYRQDVTSLMGIIQLMRNTTLWTRLTPERQEGLVQDFISRWPIYRTVVEDLLLRMADPTTVREEDTYVMDMDFLLRCLADFDRELGIKDPKMHEKFSLVVGPELLRSDEAIQGNVGLLINGLMNIVRNACTEHVDAETVELQVKRDHDMIVFEVRDTGIGMPASYLDPADDDSIFAPGRSHRWSTGYGLMHMPSRMAASGIELTVKSKQRMRDDHGKTRHSRREGFFSTNPERTPQSVWLGKVARKQQEEVEQARRFALASTVFEFRLPVVSHTV